MKANQHKLVIISIHVAIWLILFTINQLFLYNNSIEYNLLFNIGVTVLYIVVFYAALYVLIPMLFKKQVVQFALFSLLLLVGSTAVKQFLLLQHFEDVKPAMRIQFDGDRPMLPPNESFGKDDKHFSEDRPHRGPRPGVFDRRMLLFNSSSIILFYAIGFSLAFVQKWQADEEKRSNAEKERVKTELAFLKQQINPHFLFNSLNSIYSLAITQSSATTDSILKLSAILRYVLYESEGGKVSLNDEIKLIGDYIDLQKLRITDKVKVLFTVDGNTEAKKIEPFIIIPLIENAFKYGVDNINQSFIDIKIALQQDKLLVEVKNNVVPLVKQGKDSGIGLKNIERRLELLYSDGYSLNWTEKDNVFSVTLNINLGV